ncbi:hypothetical protein CCR97_11330 [Rhodoplanes elegans]|uniref:Uncharacterized protein n=1 Tax=Rhodoplanes elegans TaxID=29408 RepID=A0A327K286_9BRAD|nr:helix-turn-helix domain-containing protein [Rhodoplanes elegans]MBK5958797.1 hypothetical protein [Rhodoplanes elegans]RAI32391.1 hypothetical protein CH338_24265 [Rhodoplanes elegans]
MTYSWLPGLLAEIAEVAGLDAALALAAARGGTRVRIPAQADDDHWLVRCVGRKAADAICIHFRQGSNRPRGVYVEVPLGRTANARRVMAQALARGASAAEAARAAGMTERSAYRMRRRAHRLSDDRQARFFD